MKMKVLGCEIKIRKRKRKTGGGQRKRKSFTMMITAEEMFLGNPVYNFLCIAGSGSEQVNQIIML